MADPERPDAPAADRARTGIGGARLGEPHVPEVHPMPGAGPVAADTHVRALRGPWWTSSRPDLVTIVADACRWHGRRPYGFGGA